MGLCFLPSKDVLPMRNIKIDGLDLPIGDRLRESIELLLLAQSQKFYGSIEVICEGGQPVRVKKVESIKLGK
jgi:hypothetical protein